jgi:CPA1 family monovalent cation:H+ antiporter
MIVQTIQTFVILLAAAAAVAIVARPLRLPYSVALVAVGLLAGVVAPVVVVGLRPEVPPDAVLLVLLPGLVFEAGYRLDVAHLRRSFAALLFLAIPGVLISAAIVAVTLNVTTGLRFDLAFIVGAMVSATDPAAVVSTFRRLRVPPQLATLVEGESLLNDGTGLVVFAIAIGALSAPVSPLEALVGFAAAVGVSTAIGLAAGFVAARVMAIVDDHLIELTISVVLAYGTYLLADGLHESGVIATVVAAIVLGDHRRRRTIGATGGVVAGDTSGDVTASDPLDTVWEFLAYLLTALVFLLVGLAFPIGELAGSLGWILWGVVGTLVGRAIVVYLLLGAGARLIPMVGPRGALPSGWLHVLFWSGLRGAVAVAMALALPVSVPERALLQQITFGIVLFTLIVQGMTAGAVVRRTVGDAATSLDPTAD